MTWNYTEAFKRNLGIVTPEEQEKLKNSCVAIAGMGGVGGVHAVTLARLGIGHFHIADPDTFEVANFNRQYGAFKSTLGKPKVEVMKQTILDINPEADVKVWNRVIDQDNVDEFFDGIDLFVDGIDLFSAGAHRLCFNKAREKNIWGITCGPFSLSAVWVLFNPKGMSFDDYFDVREGMSDLDLFVAFTVGMAPRPQHRAYTDFQYFRFSPPNGSSASAGCMLSTGVVGSQALKILLNRPGIKAAPHFQQFDGYLGKLITGRLWFGNKGPIQKILRWYVKKMVLKNSTSEV